MKKQFYKMPEIAQLLSVPKSRVYQWCTENVIPHYRKGRFILFDIDEVVKWYDNYKSIGSIPVQPELITQVPPKTQVPDIQPSINHIATKAHQIIALLYLKYDDPMIKELNTIVTQMLDATA